MKPFLLAVKLAAFFALVVGIVLVGTLRLFMGVAGDPLIDALGVLRAHEGVEVARRLEPLLAAHGADDPTVREYLAAVSAERHLDFSLRSTPHAMNLREWLHRLRRPRHQRTVEIQGRSCQVLGPPRFESLVPLLQDGEEIGVLVVRGPLDLYEAHAAFRHGLLRIGAVMMACVAGLALYLTTPLRRMSHSMDRIAAGQLGHRVPVRGHDEVASMGRSFNTMADRIRAMITGQKELMAGISHELRSPLARMKMSLALLRDGNATAQRVDEIEAEVDELDDLVAELLLISRLDLGAAPLSPTTLDLVVVAEEAWARMAEAAGRRDLSLDLQVPDQARRVRADRALVGRIFGNLFTNAARYAETGRVTVSATHEASAQGRRERVAITVDDEGPGVDEAHLEQLFEPFFRADGSRSRRTGASGLGLMIVRRAVEAHGGQAHAQRSPHGGLAVCFDLPAAGREAP